MIYEKNNKKNLTEEILRNARLAFKVSKEVTDPAFRNLSDINKNYVIEHSDVTSYIPNQTREYIPRRISILKSLLRDFNTVRRIKR